MRSISGSEPPEISEATALLARRTGLNAMPVTGAARNRAAGSPEVLLVLGSGLNSLADELKEAVEVPFTDLPGFPQSGVAGHRGRFLFGLLEGKRVLIQAGRYHLYEGFPRQVVAAPMRVAARLGCRIAFLTNASGGIDPGLSPGAVMAVEDQLNLQWRSPLIGDAFTDESRVPDMSAPYDPALLRLARSTAAELRLPLHQGTYAGVLGPAYETPAEVRTLAAMGASAVGMSTIPEVLVARARGLRVFALSLITNVAAGITSGRLSHREVLRAGERSAPTISALVRGILRSLGPLQGRGA